MACPTRPLPPVTIMVERVVPLASRFVMVDICKLMFDGEEDFVFMASISMMKRGGCDGRRCGKMIGRWR